MLQIFDAKKVSIIFYFIDFVLEVYYALDSIYYPPTEEKCVSVGNICFFFSFTFCSQLVMQWKKVSSFQFLSGSIMIIVCVY